MDNKRFVGNNPELLLDYNGVGVQSFFIGGTTVKLDTTVRNSVKAENSLIRICNPGIEKASLQINGENQMTILSNSKEVVACMKGDILTVIEGTLEITFFRDKSK